LKVPPTVTGELKLIVPLLKLIVSVGPGTLAGVQLVGLNQSELTEPFQVAVAAKELLASKIVASSQSGRRRMAASDGRATCMQGGFREDCRSRFIGSFVLMMVVFGAWARRQLQIFPRTAKLERGFIPAPFAVYSTL